MGTTSSAIFKGSSSYSTDFANVINRAVAIASLPVQQLTNDKADLTSQSDELTKLDTKFSLLQSAVQKIGTALSGSAFQTSVSKDNVVDLTIADGAREGVYSINVTSVGAQEASLSARNWNVPKDLSGKAATFTLVVGNQNYKVTPADNSAQSVVDAINLNYGNLVQATTVIVAPGDTRISLRSAALGQTTLDLLQTPTGATATGLQQQVAEGFGISQSSATWDASGSPATYTLTVGGDPHEITPATNSADDVAAAINASFGDQVRASVIDAGSGTAHDYRVSLQSTTAGPMNGSMTLDLARSGGGSLQTQQTPVTNRTAAAWDAAPDADGTRSIYTLVVAGTTKYSFTPADNSAASVAAAINSMYGMQVRASVVDLGTGGSPDLRISLQSKTGSATTFDIQKTTATSFQKEQTVGALASYEINNSGVTNSSNSRNITISEGVTATLRGTTGGTPADITVTRSTSALNGALSAFADAYNAASDALVAQRGQTAGALGGNFVVTQLAGLLSGISTYSSSGQIGGLASLGLELGSDGRFTYNPFTLMTADLTSGTSVTAFLGSASGGGFIQKATEILNSVETPVTGLLKASEADMQSRISRLGETISTKQNQVNQLQIRLQNQMAVSDALIASMEQKYSYLSNMFQAQQTAEQSYK